MSFLVLENLARRYGTVAALDGISLAVPRGSRLAVLGPSGSGKSTLLRLLAGFECPDAGRIVLDGQTLSDPAAAVPAHRRGIGLVAQEGALFPHLSVADNIGFGLARRAPDREERIAALAAAVELDPAMLRRAPDALSGGQQQRVALARALAREPRLMLLDEPFSALDTALRHATRQAVSAILERAGITTILVTHDQSEALRFADQVAVLQGGRLLAAGPPRSLYLRPGDEAVACFLGPAVILPAMLEGGRARCALGLLPTDAPDAEGPARIMLREEQLLLRPATSDHIAPNHMAPDHIAPNHVTWRVLSVEFGGASCTVALVSAGGETITLAVPQHAAPEAGAPMVITVAGEAHRLLR